jgi:hypothetical protein
VLPAAEFMPPDTSFVMVFGYHYRMSRRALDCFEDREGGSWVCIRATSVKGPASTVAVQKGQTFAPKTVFAGFNVFTAYLAGMNVESAPTAQHEC